MFSPGRQVPLLSGTTCGTIAGQQSEVVLWDVATRRELRRFGGHGGWIYTLAFSPDGKILATSFFRSGRPVLGCA